MEIIENKICNHSSRIFVPKDPKEVLIAIHGFAGDKDSSVIIAIAKNLAELGVCTISFELPCHGADACNSNLNFFDCINSVAEIINFAENTYKNLPISIFATSFGAFLILNYLKTCDKKFKAVILRSPAIDMPNILVNKILPEHNLSLIDLNKTQNLGYGNPLYVDKKFIVDLYSNALDNSFSEPNNTYFILQGLKDDIVDPNYVFDFCEKHFKNRFFLYKFENADHRYKNPGELEQIVNITRNILTRTK